MSILAACGAALADDTFTLPRRRVNRGRRTGRIGRTPRGRDPWFGDNLAMVWFLNSSAFWTALRDRSPVAATAPLPGMAQ
jgi:hypothetical protein